MRQLDSKELKLVSGGSQPSVVCGPTNTSVTTSGNTTVTSSTQVCQTSSGNTIASTNTTSVTTGNVDTGISGLAKGILGIKVDGNVLSTQSTSTVTNCTPQQTCTTTTTSTNSNGQTSTTTNQTSDAGSAVSGETFAGGNPGSETHAYVEED